MSKCICSRLIEEGVFIEIPRTENPGKAKSFDIKRRRAIFYRNASGKYEIPLGSDLVGFPDYHEHRYNISYGEPEYK